MGRPPVIPVEKKTRIVLSILAGEMTIAEAARREKVSEQSIGRWKADFLEAGKTGLAAGRSGPSSRVNRSGFRSVLQARMEPMNQKYSPEMRERALRMLDEARASGDHPNLMSAVRHVAGLLGMSAETLRVWHRRREIDTGQRPGVTTDVAEENKRLQREVAELKKANEVLKAASVFFAKELDRP